MLLIFFIIFFHINIHQLNITKITKRKTIKKARERYQSLSKKEKEKKLQHGPERYQNLPEDEKQRLTEYKNILKYEKKRLIIIIIVHSI